MSKHIYKQFLSSSYLGVPRERLMPYVASREVSGSNLTSRKYITRQHGLENCRHTPRVTPRQISETKVKMHKEA